MPNSKSTSVSRTNHEESSGLEVSSETITHCAQLLADGEMDWPHGFSDEQEKMLLVAVRRCRRARLVKFIASRIAADIACERTA